MIQPRAGVAGTTFRKKPKIDGAFVPSEEMSAATVPKPLHLKVEDAAHEVEVKEEAPSAEADSHAHVGGKHFHPHATNEHGASAVQPHHMEVRMQLRACDARFVEMQDGRLSASIPVFLWHQISNRAVHVNGKEPSAGPSGPAPVPFSVSKLGYDPDGSGRAAAVR